jgi:DNA-binding response OmpR family regulator
MQLARLASRRPSPAVTAQRLFGMSPAEASLLLPLLQHDYVNKNAVRGMTAGAVDVHICKMRRRLEPYGVKIETLWGSGYRIPAADRRRALDLILAAA